MGQKTESTLQEA